MGTFDGVEFCVEFGMDCAGLREYLDAMKTFIFADRTSAMNHFEVVAATPAEAIRRLVAKHGEQPYRIVNIIPCAS